MIAYGLSVIEFTCFYLGGEMPKTFYDQQSTSDQLIEDLEEDWEEERAVFSTLTEPSDFPLGFSLHLSEIDKASSKASLADVMRVAVARICWLDIECKVKITAQFQDKLFLAGFGFFHLPIEQVRELMTVLQILPPIKHLFFDISVIFADPNVVYPEEEDLPHEIEDTEENTVKFKSILDAMDGLKTRDQVLHLHADDNKDVLKQLPESFKTVLFDYQYQQIAEYYINMAGNPALKDSMALQMHDSKPGTHMANMLQGLLFWSFFERLFKQGKLQGIATLKNTILGFFATEDDGSSQDWDGYCLWDRFIQQRQSSELLQAAARLPCAEESEAMAVGTLPGNRLEWLREFEQSRHG